MQSDYERAVELIKAKRYEDAQALLMTSDHPNAEKLLDRVNKAIAARGVAPKEAPQEKAKNVDMAAAVAEGMKQAELERGQRTVSGCFWLIVAIVICSVVMVVWTNITYQ